MSESWDKGHGCRCLASTLLLTTLCKHFISQNVWLTGLSGQFSSWTFLKYLAVKWAECSLGLPWWSRQNLKTLKNLIWMAEYVAVYRSPLKVPSQICANAPQYIKCNSHYFIKMFCFLLTQSGRPWDQLVMKHHLLGRNVYSLIGWGVVARDCLLSAGDINSKRVSAALKNTPCDCFGWLQIAMVTVACSADADLSASAWQVLAKQ